MVRHLLEFRRNFEFESGKGFGREGVYYYCSKRKRLIYFLFFLIKKRVMNLASKKIRRSSRSGRSQVQVSLGARKERFRSSF